MSANINKVVSVEISELDSKNPALFDIVTKTIIYGPCVSYNLELRVQFNFNLQQGQFRFMVSSM